jgi:hypothetical protein
MLETRGCEISETNSVDSLPLLFNRLHYEIVTTFNVEFQGLLNYYILAQNAHKRLARSGIVFGNLW